MTPLTTAALGSHLERVRARVGAMVQDRVATRLWQRDASLWTQDEGVAAKIGHRLGWLDAPDEASRARDDYRAFAAEAVETGVTHVALLGMGGSSLCPEVLRRSFSPAPGHPKLAVLDSTDPECVLALEKSLNLKHSWFVVSTKSGTTVETLSFYRFFWEAVRAAGGEPGPSFVAVTDPGTPLEQEAGERGFRRVWPGPPAVGGRYSALTPFGLVPAALLGLDLERYLERARAMRDRCRPDAEDNPGLALGAALGELALAGRDKLTLVVDKPVAAIGLWLEQLIAESLGKQGKGVVPVADEPLGPPRVYGDDRVFVHLAVGEGHPGYRDGLAELEAAGHPVLRLRLEDAYDLAGEFFRWEFATAVAGVVLGVNPFDEPNVSESKDNTNQVLEAIGKSGRFESEMPRAQEGGAALYGPPGAPGGGGGTPGEVLRGWLEQVGPGHYLALQAYLPPTQAVETALDALRLRLRDRTRAATTLGFGPRFLHSTGQLHKGGPPRGCFLQITAGSEAEVPIPGRDFSFASLIRAQALGDARSLAGRDLPLLRVHLDSPAELTRLESWLDPEGA